MPNESGESEEEALDLQEIWGVLVRGRWYILLAFVLIVGITGFLTFTADEVYQSQAKVMLKKNGDTTEFLASLVENPLSGVSDQNTLKNKKEIITSASVLKAAAKKLRKNQEYLRLWRDEAGESSPLNNLFQSIGLGAGSSSSEEFPPITAGGLKGKLEVRIIPDTDLIEMKATGGSPRSAQIVTNAILDAFNEQQLETARQDISGVKKFLEEQKTEMKERLENIESKVMQFQNRTGMVLGQSGVEKKLTQLEQMLVEARVKVRDKKDRLQAINKMLDSVKQDLFEGELADGGQTVVNEFQDKYLQLKKLKGEIEELEKKRSEYLEEDNYAKAQQLEQQIKDKRKKYQSSATEKFQVLQLLPKYEDLIKRQLEISMEVDAAQNRVKVLEGKIEGLTNKLSEHGLKLMRYERNQDVTQEIYKMILTNYEKTRITEASKLGGVRVITRANLSPNPVKPNKKRRMLLAVVLGLAVGTGLAFLKDYMDTAVRGPDAIEEQGMTNLGSIIYVEHKTNREPLEEIRETLITNFGPQSAVVDSYATLEANIRFLEIDEPLKSLLISSSTPREGKTTTAINLGLTMAQMGKRVLVVDTDLRNPMIGKVFDLKNSTGLTELAVEDLSFEEVISRPYRGRGLPVGRKLEELALERELISEKDYRQVNGRDQEEVGSYLVSQGLITKEELDEITDAQGSDLEGFHVLPTGKLPPNAAAFFNSDRWTEILANLEEAFDMVLLDSPPVPVAPDTSIVSSEVDGTALVIAAGETDIGAVEQAKEQLDKSGTFILGGILNKLRSSGSRYYGYDYYGYGYGSREEKTKDGSQA